MVKEIHVYIEGGGNQKDTKTYLRQGFSEFLGRVIETIREQHIRWKIKLSGSRGEAYEDFSEALKSRPDVFNVLLVDSEGPVNDKPYKHLNDRDGWSLSEEQNANCHLMVEMMESWFIADIGALIKFYRQGFNSHAIPRNPNVELISKAELEDALKRATIHTIKGEYHKIKHGSQILKLVDPSKVRSSAPHCDRLFTTLAEKIGVAL